MSIIYDYLSILEKKRSKENLPAPEASQAPVAATPAVLRPAAAAVRVPKKTFSVSPTLAVGLLIFFVAGILFFLGGDLKNFISAMPTKGKAGKQTAANEEPVVATAPARTGFDYSLKGIIYNATSPSAVIDGKIVSKGVMLGEWQVADISPSEVRLENPKNGSALTLKLESVTAP